MRVVLRSLLALAAVVTAHCAAATPAFAQRARVSDAVEVVEATAAAPSVTTAGTTSAPTPAPSAPAPAPAEVPAIAEVDGRDAREKLVDDWFAKYFHGLGPHLTEYLHGRLLAAVEELKALLLALPIS
jgi:hypothetical protein